MYSPFNSARICLVAASMTLVLPGCTTQSQRLGADDGTDVCRQYRVTLDSTGEYFGEDIMKGAAMGAVGGGLAGLLISGNARGALIGAVAGGALGAAGGYWKARQQQQQDQATLYRTVSADINRDNAQIDKSQLAFNQLIECRQRSANAIRADLRAGRLTRAQAEAAMADVKRRANGDVQIAEAMQKQIQGRSADFEFAARQVNPSYSYNPGAPARVASARPAPGRTQYAPASGSAAEVQSATSTNLAKRDQFSRTVTQARAQQTAFELG